MGFQRKKPAAIGIKANFPGFIEPALASSIEKVPSGARWLHEIKFDGYRVQLHIANEDINVFTRRGNDWTKRFKKIAADAYPTATRRSRLLFFALEQASRYGIGAMKEAGGIKWLRATRAL